MTKALIVLAALGTVGLMTAGVVGLLAFFGVLSLYLPVALAVLGATLSIAANVGIIIHLVVRKKRGIGGTDPADPLASRRRRGDLHPPDSEVAIFSFKRREDFSQVD